MICPVCGTHIQDNSRVCPACRATLVKTEAGARAESTFCRRCGALVPAHERYCPSCGMPTTPEGTKPASCGIPEPKASSSRLDSLLADPAQTGKTRPIDDPDQTHSIPRVESAVPGEPEAGAAGQHDHMPRTRAILLAAVAAVVVVGGLALAIVHPWDPDAYSTRAKTAADTSKAGYPGAITSLAGQDSEAATTQTLSGDDATYLQLKDDYDTLGDIASSLDESESLFTKIATSGSAEERQEASDDASALSIRLSNVIDDIGSADVSSGTYADERDDLLTLGNWLRNRADALTEAWSRSAESADPAADASYITSPVEKQQNDDGKDTYASLFDENYKNFEPQKTSSSSS